MKNVAIREHHLYNKAFQRGKRQVGKYVAVYVLRDLAAKRLRNAHPEKISQQLFFASLKYFFRSRNYFSGKKYRKNSKNLLTNEVNCGLI